MSGGVAAEVRSRSPSLRNYDRVNCRRLLSISVSLYFFSCATVPV